MDVIGNNIANVNTAGYKASRVIFQDIFSQTVKGGMANTGINGGTNPVQIGLGIKLSTIDVMHTPAPYGRTDNPFDMMVEGDGFFIVGYPTQWDVDGNPIAFDKYYTRAGNFKLDDQGYLTNSDGYYVLGYAAEIVFYPEVVGSGTPGDPGYVAPSPARIEFGNIGTSIGPIRLTVDETSDITVDGGGVLDPTFVLPGDLVGFAVADDGSVSVMLNNEKQVIAKLSLAMFSNPGGLDKAGNSLYRATASSGDPWETEALLDGAGKVSGGGLEMSNVDLATEFTDMIVTQRGFQANSRIITVSDTLLEELVNLKR